MNKPPQNPIRDLSNNCVNITKDLSNNCVDINRKLFGNKIIIPSLHNSRKKKFIFNKYLNNNDNNLNNSNNYFNMKIKSLLDNLQNERNRINNQYLLQLEDRKKNKEGIDNYLQNINNKYDLLYNNNYSVIHKKPPGLNKVINPFLHNPMPNPFDTNLKPKIELINIEVEIENINDILDLIKKYPLKWDVRYNINMQALHNIKTPLTNLNNMIGMKGLKSNIVDQILYFAQNLHKNGSQDNIDFMHTVIYGPPGTGKTEIANIIGKIFSNLGILKNKIFKKATRSELIAGFLGQTALKTQELIKSCLGGCLFIDEAYALGNSEKRDSFAKECIDTLCEALSFHKNDIMVIIAGYEKDLKDCFFAYNSGLESRFTWRFNTDNYNSSELNQIFQKKVKDISWEFDDTIQDKWFEDKMDYFKYYGRDMETLLAKTKIAHSKRVFCKPDNEKRKITKKDLDKGFEKFISNDEVKNRKQKNTVPHMYI